VRKASVQVLSAAAHGKPALVLDRLPSLMPLLFEQTKIDTSLIRTVDLGPFKHQVDDGLELRKASYECIDVLLDRCASAIDPGQILECLLSGLKDHYDVKMPCHLMVSKLASEAPGEVGARLDRLAEPLAATLGAKVKADAVKQEVDRNEDMLRSCLRAVDDADRVPAAAGAAGWRSFVRDAVELMPEMKRRFEDIRSERKEAVGGAE
jgi:cullin-associated NEDD8-dissociated protein 1